MTASNTVNWSGITVSGHSQGGGHAAFLAKYHNLDRVLMFASPNEYSSFYAAPASWTNLTGVTPDSSHFGFGNLYDDIIDFDEQYEVWGALHLNTFGDTVCVEHISCPYNNTRMLYTQDTTGDGLAAHHNSVLIDNYTPLVSDTPAFTPAWKYLLGLCGISTFVADINTHAPVARAYPNPASSMVRVECSDVITRLEVFNSLGINLAIYEPGSKEVEVRTETFAGVIFLKIYTNSKSSQVIKVLVH